MLFKALEKAISDHSNKKAFFIEGVYYSYKDLAEKISGIRSSLNSNPNRSEKNVGLITNDDLETYAAIIAIWFEGYSYVPINPQMPHERNESTIQQANIKTIIDSSEQVLYPKYFTIRSNKLASSKIDLIPKSVSGEEMAYTIFTSGSSGVPKGVPITINNLTGFVNAFFLLKPDLNENDRWLQMFELTFDLSIMSYLIPLLTGACVYCVAKNKIKYSQVFELLDEHRLTVALMIPSIIHYLTPYFDEINLPDLKYNLFCGEALSYDTTKKWSKCVPDAEILNVYGPSEATIFCTHYLFNRNSDNKTHNGILSIGKPMDGTRVIIVDTENDLVKQGEIGELCLSGAQITPGYLYDQEKNSKAFFDIECGGKKERYYKTGDLCFVDPLGDIMYVGRGDSQIKIHGYRVELSELEFYVKTYLIKVNAIALAFTNKSKQQEIGIFIESDQFDTTQLIQFLKANLPFYMIPTQIRFEKIFPLNSNGKVDRKDLSNKLQQ